MPKTIWVSVYTHGPPHPPNRKCPFERTTFQKGASLPLPAESPLKRSRPSACQACDPFLLSRRPAPQQRGQLHHKYTQKKVSLFYRNILLREKKCFLSGIAEITSIFFLRRPSLRRNPFPDQIRPGKVNKWSSQTFAWFTLGLVLSKSRLHLR